ncbi:MAG: NADH-quinone oxidoreductase subunit N, partial [Candidatus Omnitrophica bacterium]|nr:NADH-quinone oxidoreductase subunit N [Candidatus Omnitrophota bacterium]
GSLAALSANGSLFGGCYQADSLSQIFKAAIALGFFFIIAFSDKTIAINLCVRPEYYFFLSTGTLGLMMLTSAVELLTLYVGLELASYSFYILVPLRRQGLLSSEGGIKYLLFGAAASGLMLYGMSLLFGITQTSYFSQMSATIAGWISTGAIPAALPLALFLILAAFFFKLSAFPFHFWAPDVYEAAATQVTAFIATVSKAAAIAVFLRFFQFFGSSLAQFTPLLVWIAFISMTLGNLTALIQGDMKRMLAYSSIAQAGYMLVGLLAQTPAGYTAVLFYAIVYLVMNAAAFLVTEQVGRNANQDNPQIETFAGLAERSPLLALTLLLSLLSLAGIPPLVGFTGKWVLFTAAMEQGYLWLVLAGVINSVISLCYYLMVVKQCYWAKPVSAQPLTLPFHTRLLSYAFILAIVALGVLPTFLITQAQNVIAALIP